MESLELLGWLVCLLVVVCGPGGWCEGLYNDKN